MKLTKFVAFIAAATVCLTAVTFVPGPVQAAGGTFAVAGLKTNGQVNPIGIDDGPVFSWQMVSPAIGKSQSAYQITVASDSGFTAVVWDSGKTAGGASVGIAYGGPALAASTAYYWRVTVWDEGGASVTSGAATFEMGLLGAAAWSGSDWIGLGTPPVHYSVEADLTIIHQAVGIVFNYTDSSHFLMWQINMLDSEAGAGNVTFRPHRWNGGGATTGAQPVLSSFPGLMLTRADMAGAGAHMRIDVTDSTIRTYITKIGTADEVLIDTRTFSSTGLTAKLTPIGIRSNFASSTNYEEGTVDNLKLTDYSKDPVNGKVVYFYDFNDGSNPFSNGTVSNGVLDTYNMNVSMPNPNWQTPVNYVVEADVAVTNNAVGLAFNARDNNTFLMWQLNTNPSEMLNGHATLRPHRWPNPALLSGTGAPVDLYNVTGLNLTIAELSTTGVHMTIKVTNAAIMTYIRKPGGSDVLVSTVNFTDTGQTAYAGMIGIREDGAEAGYVSNYKMTDYAANPQGVVVYNYDFSQGNPFVKGSVIGDKLQTSGMGVSFPYAPQSSPSPYPTFRKKVDIGANVEWARLYLTGLGSVGMYINGSRVGEKTGSGVVCDELLPGYTNPAGPGARVNYYTYDVTSWLQTGQNLLSAVVTSGWYGSRISSGTGRTLELRAKLLVKYAGNPTPAVIGTGTDWLTSTASGVRAADIYDGETYDANISNDWRDAASYDDSAWAAASVKTDWTGVINAVPGAKVRLRGDLTRTDYTAVTYNGASGADTSRYGKINVTGNYAPGQAFPLAAGEKAVIDFKQNFAGWPEITVSGAKGTVVTMRVGEMLNDNNGLMSRGNDGPEGSVYKANYRGALSMGVYIMNGQGDETYHSTQTFYGFRYLEISANAPITVKAARGLVLTSVQNELGSIVTSSPDVNQLISNVRWGGYSNLLSTATDCPQRDERQGWTADTQVYTTTGLYNSDMMNFYMKFMDDMRDCADTNTGAFANTVPWFSYGGGSGQLGWADAGVIIPYNVYKMTGDKTILTQNWDAMKKFMDVYMASTNKNGGGHSFGDWLAYESNDDTIKNICGVAYYAWDALMMADMANALGSPADAARYQQVYLDEKAYFQQLYVKPDGSLTRTEQTACLMALAFNLLPNDASKATVKQALLNDIASHGNKLQTGFLGTALIMRTLSDIGSTDMAYKLLMQRGNPSWFYSIDQGATTMWERWNSYTKESGFGDVGMNSFNHYAYGSVAEWLYGYMCGIMYDINQPGYKHIILQPTPEQIIQSANASYDSAYGTITSNWKYEGNTYIYDAGIPANTTATVYLPVEAGKSFTVNGKDPAALSLAADGIVYTGVNADGKAVFNAVSGSYHFEAAITAMRYITVVNSNPQVQLRLLVNGQPADPSEPIAVQYNVPATFEVQPYNDVDYSFASWSGGAVSNMNPLTFTPLTDTSLTLNWSWNGWNSLAAGKAVYSPNTMIVSGADNWNEPSLTDGTLISIPGALGWTSGAFTTTTPSPAPWVRIDLGASTAFNRIHLYPRTDKFTAAGATANFPISCMIEGSDTAADGSWFTIDSRVLTVPPYKTPLVIILPGTVSARYVRITAQALSGSTESETSDYFQLAEAGIYNDPSPGFGLSVSQSGSAVTAVLVNNTAAARGANLLIGAYRDGRLVRVINSAVNVVSAGNARITMDFSGQDMTGCVFKAFAWDQLTFMPLCPSAVL